MCRNRRIPSFFRLLIIGKALTVLVKALRDHVAVLRDRRGEVLHDSLAQILFHQVFAFPSKLLAEYFLEIARSGL